MGRITTHVLDLAAGRPAAGLTIELHRVGAGRLASGATNGDGRIERPLLEGEALTAGTYELQFHVGDYWRSGGAANAEAGFLDIVPIRFGVASPDQHYHVPLLLSPFGYSTYRGS